jgi:hypothetical protein
MNLISPSIASSPANPAWDEAFLRVESYLRAYHLESRVLLNQLATEIIDEARAGEPHSPLEPPVTRAMRVTRARIEAWCARAGSDFDEPSERNRAHGRLALVIANLTGRWSNHFFSAEAVPPELSAAMGSFRFQPGPELRYSNMPPAPLEFGFDEVENPHVSKQGLRFLTRAACSWLVVVGLIGVAWAASH